MSVPMNLDGFDVEQAVDRMLGREDLWWQALLLFVDHFAGWEHEWHAVRGDDAEERRLVHALRSAALNVGANRLATAATVLEDLLLIRLAGGQQYVPSSIRWYLQDCWRQTRSVATAACRAYAEGTRK